MSDIKSAQDIAREADSLDEGFCNSRKLRVAEERYEDNVQAIMERGYTRVEAEAMIAEHQ